MTAATVYENTHIHKQVRIICCSYDKAIMITKQQR